MVKQQRLAACHTLLGCHCGPLRAQESPYSPFIPHLLRCLTWAATRGRVCFERTSALLRRLLQQQVQHHLRQRTEMATTMAVALLQAAVVQRKRQWKEQRLLC